MYEERITITNISKQGVHANLLVAASVGRLYGEN